MVSARRGFTLVEVLVAFMLFAIAWLGLVGMTAFATATLNTAAVRERAAVTVAALLDSLTLAPVAASGRALRDGLIIEWTASSLAGDEVRVRALGPRGVVVELVGRRLPLPASTP